MKIEEIKQENRQFKPVSVNFTFELLNELKSLYFYLNLPEDYVKRYYFDLNNKSYTDFDGKDTCSIKIKEIKKVDDSTLNFLNNIVLSNECY